MNWKLAIPIGLDVKPDASFADFIEPFKKMGADASFLCIDGNGERIIPDEYWQKMADRLRWVCKLYKENGITPWCWIGFSIGHGGEGYSNPEDPEIFTELVTSQGKRFKNVGCPFDKNLQKYMENAMRIVASSGVDAIMMDDDFRLSTKDSSYPGCFCKLHVKEYNKRLGKEYTAQELCELYKTDLKIRNVIMDVMADSLYELAGAIGRGAVAGNPKVRVGLATAMSQWGEDGTDMHKLLRAFNPTGNEPFLRLCGAPYWAVKPQDLLLTTEYSRLQEQQWAPDIFTFAEGDTYPRKTFQCAASILDAYMDALLAGGVKRCLSYLTCYKNPWDDDPQYTKHLIASKASRDAIEAAMPAGVPRRGLRPVYAQNGSRVQDVMPIDKIKAGRGFFQSSPNWFDKPSSLAVLTGFGIPLTFNDPDAPVVLAGDGLKAFSDAELKELVAHPLMLDLPAAKALNERGFAVEIPEGKAGVNSILTGIGKSSAAFKLYTDSNGLRRAVTFRNFSLEEDTWDLMNAGNQTAFLDAAEFLLGEALPLRPEKEIPYAHMFWTEGKNGTVTVAIQNLSLDTRYADDFITGEGYVRVSDIPAEGLAPLKTIVLELKRT